MLCDTMTSFKCEGEVMKRAPAAIITLISISVFVLLSSCATLGGPVSYLQDPEEIYIMEAGILRNEMEFADGTDMELSYEFDEPEYKVLIEKYGIDRIAGEGTEFQRALRLMSEFAPRLRHASNYDNHITMEALPLLEYCLDKPGNGINCRSKAQIFTEMCLALGIHARKVFGQLGSFAASRLSPQGRVKLQHVRLCVKHRSYNEEQLSVPRFLAAQGPLHPYR